MKFKDYHIAPSECPICEKKMDGATAVDHTHKPTPGDGTVCSYCASMLVYGSNLKLHEITLEEIAGFKEQPEMWKLLQNVQYAIHKVMMERNHGLPNRN